MARCDSMLKAHPGVLMRVPASVAFAPALCHVPSLHRSTYASTLDITHTGHGPLKRTRLLLCRSSLCTTGGATTPGPHLSIQAVFPGIRIPIIKIRRPFYLYKRNPYTGKTASLYWNGPRISSLEGPSCPVNPHWRLTWCHTEIPPHPAWPAQLSLQRTTHCFVFIPENLSC